jgi:hypothetical protein
MFSCLFPALIYAYIFGLIPAILYTIAMELWFHFGLRSRFGLLCTATLSGILGASAGYLSSVIGRRLEVLTPSDCHYFLQAGVVGGLLIGFYVGRKQTSAA